MYFTFTENKVNPLYLDMVIVIMILIILNHCILELPWN